MCTYTMGVNGISDAGTIRDQQGVAGRPCLGVMQEGLEVAGSKAVYGVLRVGSVPPQLDLPPSVCVEVFLVPACTLIHSQSRRTAQKAKYNHEMSFTLC